MDKQTLEQWAKKYGAEHVHRFVIEDENGKEVEFFLLDPKKVARPYSLYSRAITYSTNGQLLELGSLIINECWLGGDSRVKDDRESLLHITAAVQVRSLQTFLSRGPQTTLSELLPSTRK